MYSFAYSVMKNNLKSLREKEVEKKKNIYIKVQIDRAFKMDRLRQLLVAENQYGHFQQVVNL